MGIEYLCKRAALLVAAAATLPAVARADDTNYQTYVLGERALGMGGAYTALADDASGSYYNPAGLAMVESTSISGSFSVYGVERRVLREAVGPAVDVQVDRTDLESSNVPTIPTTVGFLYKWGKRYADQIKRYAAGYAVFVPHHRDFHFSGRTTIGADPAALDDFIVDQREEDKTVWQGPTFAFRLNSRLSLGLSAFHVYRRSRWSQEVRQIGPRDDNLFADFIDEQRSSIERSVHSLVFKAGARYELTPRWKLGLALTSPSITVFGSGGANSTTTTYESSCVTPPRCVRHEELGGSIDADSRTPLSVRAGVAYRVRDRATASLDVSWHAPLTYDPFDLAQDASKFGDTGPVTLSQLRRRSVVNVNVGGEWLFEWVVLRAGFFTNFSSAPKIERSAFASPPRVHMFGTTLSAGFRWRKYTISIGALYSFGSGQSAALTPEPAGSAVSRPYGPIDERRDYVYFFISGAQDALKKTLVGFFRPKRPEKPAEKRPAPQRPDKGRKRPKPAPPVKQPN